MRPTTVPPSGSPPIVARHGPAAPRSTVRPTRPAARLLVVLATLAVVAACAGPPGEPTSATVDAATQASGPDGTPDEPSDEPSDEREPATPRGGEEPQKPPGRQPVVTTAPPVDGIASFDGVASCGTLFWNGGVAGLELTDGITFHVERLEISGDDWRFDDAACGDLASGGVCVDVDLPPDGCRLSAVPVDPEHVDLEATVRARGWLRCAETVSDADCAHAVELMLAAPGGPLPLVDESQRPFFDDGSDEPSGEPSDEPSDEPVEEPGDDGDQG